MKKLITECAKRCGASDIGFTSAQISEKTPEVFLRDVPFCKGSADERINPNFVMADAKTVIVLLFSYKTKMCGNISKYAHGKDYHLVLKQRCQPILDLISEKGFTAEFFCDDAVLDERYLARKAGLGFIGENGFLISPKFGSFVFIAHILTDMVIDYDEENNDLCIKCGNCKKACPTGALVTGDFYSCISYITQKKGELSEEEQMLIKDNKMCWGCDICQECCPHNKDVPDTEITEFLEDLITDFKSLCMSNREFKKMYSDRAFSWRGKGVLERNFNIINNKE